MVWLSRLVAALAVSYTGSGLVSALPSLLRPLDDPPVPTFNQSDIFADYPPVGIYRRQDETADNGDKIELRILPLGASIMSGVGSPEHSGLRKWLRVALRIPMV